MQHNRQDSRIAEEPITGGEKAMMEGKLESSSSQPIPTRSLPSVLRAQVKTSGDGDETQNHSETKGVSSPATSTSIAWYKIGEGLKIVVDGVVVEIRVIGRKGRGVRIRAVGPAGAMFADLGGDETC